MPSVLANVTPASKVGFWAYARAWLFDAAALVRRRARRLQDLAAAVAREVVGQRLDVPRLTLENDGRLVR